MLPITYVDSNREQLSLAGPRGATRVSLNFLITSFLILPLRRGGVSCGVLNLLYLLLVQE